MKNRILILLIFPAIFLIVFGFLMFFDKSLVNKEVQSDLKTTQIPEVNSANTLSEVQINEYSVQSFTYSGWIPSWGSSSGLDSLRRNNKLINSISPVWYELNPDGSLKTRYPAQRQDIINVAKESEIKLIPAIAMFDHELFTKVLQSQENLDRHVDSIVRTVIDNHYDGIDLDYESTKLSDKTKYFEMLQKLSSKLHESDKQLIVTVIAKWGDDIVYPSLKETRQVQDWNEISLYADQIRIMAYDYTFARSKFPGPIGPLNWIDEVLKYAVTKVNPEKLILGIHLYSYEWKGDTNEPLPFIANYMGNSNGSVDASSYVYSQVKNILKDHDGNAYKFEGEEVFEYKKDGIYRSLVYISPQGVLDRTDLAMKYKLGGVVFWRLGGEDELLTNLYNVD